MNTRIMLCPEHAKPLTSRKTKFGVRWSCQVDGCTVAAWNGSTSTPADLPTRQARLHAHEVFDSLWKSHEYNRTNLYRMLARHMKMTAAECHIGRFDRQQCKEVMKFAKELTHGTS